MNKVTRFVACLLAMASLFTSVAVATDEVPNKPVMSESAVGYFSDGTSITTERINTVFEDAASSEEVLDTFDFAVNDLSMMCERGEISQEMYVDTISQLKNARNEQLEDLGVEYYIVTKDNISEVESILKTDFSEMGVDFEDPDSPASFLITLPDEEGDPNGVAPASSVSSSVSYTYNGTTYYLRMLTLNADDDSSYNRTATDIDLLTTKTQTGLKNLINLLFSCAISSSSKSIGYFCDLLGIEATDIGAQSSSSVLKANCAASWKYVFRQVYNSSNNTWTSGSCVGCAKCTYSLYAFYYSSAAKGYTSKSTNNYFWQYSECYYDTEWQKSNAVKGYLNGRIYYDRTGAVCFKSGGYTIASLDDPAA